MQTPINQDFDKYRDDFFKGLSKRETLWGALAFIVGATCIALMFLYLHIPIELAVFLSLPFMAPIALNGFYKKNGMYFIQVIKLKFKIKNSQTLVLKCDDPRTEKIQAMEKIYAEQNQKQKGKNKNGKEKVKAI